MNLWKILILVLSLFPIPNATFAKEWSCNSSKPINTINEMFLALDACWQPPKGTAGMSITLRFSLRRDGSLIGKPQTTYTKKIANDELSKAFVASVLQALDKALPLTFTESMGGAIAGRPIALLFVSHADLNL